MRTRVIGGLIWGTVCLTAAAAWAATPAQISLNKCQNTVRNEGKKFVQNYVTAFAACLQKASTDIVQNGSTPSSATATVCVTQLRKIYDSRALGKSLIEKFESKITTACTAGSHTLQDILGSGAGVPEPLDAENLGSYCAHFGGDGAINSLTEWIDCVSAAHTCAAHSALATQFPRALEWMAALQTPMAGVTPPPLDLNKVSDALAALTAADSAIEGSSDDDQPDIQCGGIVSSGDAASADVLSGQTFSNSSAGNLTGTMLNHGAFNAMPGVAAVTIPLGYHNGLGSVAGEPNLVSANIRSGYSIFGVFGNPNVVDTSDGDAADTDVISGKKAWVDGSELIGTGILASGDATAADVLTGKTFSNASSAGASGSMPNNGAFIGMPGTAAVTIPLGYHNGFGSVVGDTDLVAGNIKSGVNIFGVSGTLQPPPLKTGQTTSYGSGSDGDLQKGASRSYTFNTIGMDRTITDNTTGLMWEVKSADGSIHDKDNIYTWGMTSSPYTMNGTMITTFLATLNTMPCYAGYCDWRMPNVNELQSIANYETFNPSVNSAFNSGCMAGCTVSACSCTQSDIYLSASTIAGDPVYAWIVNFYYGNAAQTPKDNTTYGRAVRGGF